MLSLGHELARANKASTPGIKCSSASTISGHGDKTKTHAHHDGGPAASLDDMDTFGNDSTSSFGGLNSAVDAMATVLHVDSVVRGV